MRTPHPPSPHRPAWHHRRCAVGVVLWAMGGAGCSEFAIRDNPGKPETEVTVTETFQQFERPRVDLLFVVDNTASMEPARAVLADAATVLLAALDEDQLAWQVGVVSTDLDSAESGILQGDPWIITPNTPDGSAALSNALDVTPGQAPTGGLAAATRALTEPRRSAQNRGFRREDSALHVVVLSDADDQSESVLGINPADAFLELLDDEAATSGQPASLSAVVGDPGTGCTGTAGTALPGDTYAAVASASGGALASICEADLAGVVLQLGTLVQEGVRRFELQAVPVPDSIRVEVDGSRLDELWTLEMDPPAIRLDDPPLPGSTVSVRYTIARSVSE